MLVDGAAEVFADVAGAVVAHDPLHLDAALGEALERVLEKGHGVSCWSASGAVARPHSASDRRQPGADSSSPLVDCDAHALAERPFADLPETPELLDIEMHELTRSGVLVAIGRRARAAARREMPCRRSTRQIVAAGQPSTPASASGPSPSLGAARRSAARPHCSDALGATWRSAAGHAAPPSRPRDNAPTRGKP